MELFTKLNKLIEDPNKRFIPDMQINKTNTIVFTTVYNDLSVIPTHWYDNGLAYTDFIQQEATWLNKNVFQVMIDNIIWKDKVDTTTTLVKLRIFRSKIDHLPITKIQKAEWDLWVIDLFWARTRAIFDYYLSDIVELPF